MSHPFLQVKRSDFSIHGVVVYDQDAQRLIRRIRERKDRIHHRLLLGRRDDGQRHREPKGRTVAELLSTPISPPIKRTIFFQSQRARELAAAALVASKAKRKFVANISHDVKHSGAKE
jgi:hypothetical protein